MSASRRSFTQEFKDELYREVISTPRAISLIESPTLHRSHTSCRLSDGNPGRPIFAMQHSHES
jgi:hypothetical protein